jgi:hypothetical protein
LKRNPAIVADVRLLILADDDRSNVQRSHDRFS